MPNNFGAVGSCCGGIAEYIFRYCDSMKPKGEMLRARVYLKIYHILANHASMTISSKNIKKYCM